MSEMSVFTTAVPIIFVEGYMSCRTSLVAIEEHEKMERMKYRIKYETA
jgi:hypothetical protein